MKIRKLTTLNSLHLKTTNAHDIVKKMRKHIWNTNLNIVLLLTLDAIVAGQPSGINVYRTAIQRETWRL